MNPRAAIAAIVEPGFSYHVWLQLLKLLHESQERDDFDDLIDHADGLISGWSDEERTSRDNNFLFSDHRELSPILRLARGLVLSRKREERVWLWLQLLAKTPHADRLASVELRSCELYLDSLGWFCEHARLPGLRALIVHNTLLDKGVADSIARSPVAGQLERLEINGTRLI